MLSLGAKPKNHTSKHKTEIERQEQSRSKAQRPTAFAKGDRVNRRAEISDLVLIITTNNTEDGPRLFVWNTPSLKTIDSKDTLKWMYYEYQ